MKIIKITFLLFPFIILAKPIYGDEQIELLLKNHCKNTFDFPELLGIHIYNDKKGRVLQLDIEVTKNNNHIIMTMDAMSQIGQYSKTSFHKFIIIEHYLGNKIPTGYESNADCAINYFVRKKTPKNAWMKDCLRSGILQRKIENWSTLNKD